MISNISLELIVKIDGEIHNSRIEYHNLRDGILVLKDLLIVKSSSKEIKSNF
ncbi:MAG: hypothetical protein KAR07_09510 [Spirochaetes bacterium]|nr:hypothetical protein [Spirochaetota bacterium]MCK5268394.1 hypothetical protein [Spirochaetota bacterium]